MYVVAWSALVSSVEVRVLNAVANVVSFVFAIMLYRLLSSCMLYFYQLSNLVVR